VAGYLSGAAPSRVTKNCSGHQDDLNVEGESLIHSILFQNEQLLPYYVFNP